MERTTIIILLFISISVILSGCSNQSTEGKTYYFDKDGKTVAKKLEGAEMAVADKLEVYYFHRTARCYSCNVIGQYTSELMEEKYSQEIKDNKIDFKQLNVDLSENKEIATKYRASGSSLFINRIIDEQDNIEQDTRVWRLLGDELGFKEYLQDKIDSYLGIN